MINDMKNALLCGEKPSLFFEQLRGTGELGQLFPELEALIGVPQNRTHHCEGDVWTHTMMVLDEAAKRRSAVKEPLGFMLAALCHDFGKAVCTSVSEDGTVHSYGHETEGLPLVRSFMEHFTDDERLTDYVLNMAELHMEPNKMAQAESKLKKTNRLFDSAFEPFDLIQLAVCDGLGKLPVCNDSEDFLMQRLKRYNEIMARPCVTEADLTGEGLVPPGCLAEVLAYAHKLRLAGLDRDDQLRQCLAYARTLPKNEPRRNIY